MILTYRYGIKDETTGKHLDVLARSENRIWNYCSEVQEASKRQNRPWPTAFDLIKLSTASAAMLDIHSDTVQAVGNGLLRAAMSTAEDPALPGISYPNDHATRQPVTP